MRRRLAERLGCAATREAVAEAGRAAFAADPAGYNAVLFRDANVAGLVYDEGYPQPTIPHEDFATAAGAQVHRVARIEPFIAALGERAGSYGELEEALVAELEEALVAELERAADDPGDGRLQERDRLPNGARRRAEPGRVRARLRPLAR